MKSYALYLAWLLALGGFVLSFYFGEIAKIEPCHLCWYQRIALFPLVFLLGIAVYRQDKNFIPYALVLAGAGFVFASYHWLETYFPALRSSTLCGYVHDCSETLFMLFDVITFPALSAIGFLCIFTLLVIAHRSKP